MIQRAASAVVRAMTTFDKCCGRYWCVTSFYLSFFTDGSLQASQQDTIKQGVTKEEENRRIEAKENDTSATRPRYETSFDE